MTRSVVSGFVFALLLVPAAQAFGEEVFYRSTDFGMRLEQVSRFRMDDHPYVLGVERTAQREVRRLYGDGKEIRRWETELRAGPSGSEEREFRGELLVAVLVMDGQGDLREESEYKDGLLAVRTVFQRTGRVLTGLSAYDGDGSLLYSEEYLRGRGSGLREIRRTFADGTAVWSTFRGDGTDISEEIHTTGDTEFRVRYDLHGRAAVSETRKAGALVVRETTEYAGDDGTPARFLEDWPAARKKVERTCDAEGRVVRETVAIDGKTLEESEYLWDGEGRNTGRRRRSGAGIEEWAWTYGPDGAMEREEYLLRGKREKVVLYTGDGTRTEELYRDGDLFLKAWYVDDRRVKEEVYEKGKIVRERAIP